MAYPQDFIWRSDVLSVLSQLKWNIITTVIIETLNVDPCIGTNTRHVWVPMSIC